MGLFDVFKRKQVAEDNSQPSLASFSYYYLYGFTDKPNMVATDHHLVGELYRKIIGEIGGIAIINSFHPYFIVNQKGTTVWQAAYVKAYVDQNHEELFNNIRVNNAIYTVDTSAVFMELNLWPDTRLTYEENPLFSTYVPFVIPFLVHKSAKRIRWDNQIEQGVAQQGHASDYVESITSSIRFFMPEPAFVMGFDEFNETNPSKLIDNFINCKSMFSGH